MSKGSDKSQESTSLTIVSKDSAFMARLIDWLNKAVCKKGSTLLRHNDRDPREELDELRASFSALSAAAVEERADLLRRIDQLEREKRGIGPDDHYA